MARQAVRSGRVPSIIGVVLLALSSLDHYLYVGDDLELNVRFVPGLIGAVFLIVGLLRLFRRVEGTSVQSE
ncbi:hypothetical protein [uncultured Pseudokineococcus sp.]|uniref:hypothetical protein n=1 Tax=uncultured Pseudokineococcus sp. TaxID=1642928 RepID=UPI002601803D|nr:hypothetical protein [uncultured Pseudokineococcus sp.]